MGCHVNKYSRDEPGLTISETLKERGSRYGEFAKHGEISQGLKDVMRCVDGWNGLPLDMRESLEMIQHKIARILNGDPEYIDSWHDISGYAQLIENRLKETERGLEP